MKKLLIICGPTATGKTSLGIFLAKKFGGEIVSADSRQVYKGMDIATGKDLPVNSKFQIPNSKFRELNLGYCLFEGIPVWMLDVVRPNQEFSVAHYLDLAWKVIEEIWERGKLPIIVGGTGFYIKGLIDGIESLGMPPDWELREKLSNLEIKKLREMLQKLNPKRWEAMNESDRNNPRRLIRAIEITQYGSTSEVEGPRPAKRGEGDTSEVKTRSVLFIGLTAQSRELYQRIDNRVKERVKMGIIDEIKKLLVAGYSWENSVLGTTIGYKEWQPFFENKSTLDEVAKKWKFAEHGYARRQMTWFKKDKRVQWFDITNPNFEEEIEKLVSRWYNSSQYANSN